MLENAVRPASALFAHLGNGPFVDSDEFEHLAEAVGDNVRSAHQTELARQGRAGGSAKLLIEGWAARVRYLPDGRRQILAFLIPGDFCIPPFFDQAMMDHTVVTLSPVRYVEVTSGELDKLIARSPRIAAAFRWMDQVDISLQREWTLNIGQRDARTRVAHLFCEIAVRLSSRALGSLSDCPFPPTQTDVADATGLTAVHVNRMLQSLREDGLIGLQAKTLSITNFRALARTAMFDPAYLLINSTQP